VFFGYDLPLKSGPFGSNSIPVSITSIAALDNYVCVECGYLESYIAEKDKVREIEKKWRNINEPAPSDEGGGEAS